MKKKIITIAGVPGSGKSTTARKIAEKLNYKHFSSGDIFREVAAEHGVDIAGINKISETDTKIDFEVDQKLREMGTKESELVVDSRTAFHWMPASFKVYLKLDIDIAADRVLAQIKKGGRKSQTAESAEEVRVDIETRMTSELKRYGKLYNLDYTDEDHYDLVIDTANYPLDDVVDMIMSEYMKRHLSGIKVIDNQ